jgi:3-hydroxy-D-aspartate aldolase
MDNLRQIAQASSECNAFIYVLIEVNAGQNRCGINVLDDNGRLCIELAQMIEACPQLHFKGIHCYHGGIQHTRNAKERRQQVLDGPVFHAMKAIEALKTVGVTPEVVTGGGTGSFPFECESGCFNEIQPGSYCFMDADYGANDDTHNLFENALFLHTMVVSKRKSRVVLDAGTKASSYDSGLPIPLIGWINGCKSMRIGKDMVELQKGGDEHSILVGEYANKLSIGETLRLIPGHVDPTVNMHNFLVLVDEVDNQNNNDTATSINNCISQKEPIVVDIWPITGRSPGL